MLDYGHVSGMRMMRMRMTCRLRVAHRCARVAMCCYCVGVLLNRRVSNMDTFKYGLGDSIARSMTADEPGRADRRLKGYGQ